MTVDKVFIKQNLELFKKILTLQPAVTKDLIDSIEKQIVTVQELNRLYIFNDDRVNALINMKKNMSQFLPLNFNPSQDFDITQKLMQQPYNLQQFFTNDPNYSIERTYNVFQLKTNIGNIEDSKPYYLNVENLKKDYKNNVIQQAKQKVGIGGTKQVSTVALQINSPGQKQSNRVNIYGSVTKGNAFKPQIGAVNHKERVSFQGATLPANPSDPDQVIHVDGKTVVFTKGDSLTDVLNKVKAQLEVFVDIYQSVTVSGNTIDFTYTNFGPQTFQPIVEISGQTGITYTSSTLTVGKLFVPAEPAQIYNISINGTNISIANGDTAEQVIDKIVLQTITDITVVKNQSNSMNFNFNTIGQKDVIIQLQEAGTGISVTNEVLVTGFGSNIQQAAQAVDLVGIGTINLPPYMDAQSVLEFLQNTISQNPNFVTYFDGQKIVIESIIVGAQPPLVINSVPELQFTQLITIPGSNQVQFSTKFPSDIIQIENLFIDSTTLYTDPLNMKKKFAEIYEQIFKQFEILDIIDTDDSYKISINTNQSVALFSLYVTQIHNMMVEYYPDIFTAQNVLNKLQKDLGNSNWFTNTQVDNYIKSIGADTFKFFPLTQVLILEMLNTVAIQHYDNITINNPLISVKQTYHAEMKTNITTLLNLVKDFIKVLDSINNSTYKYMKVYTMV